MRWGKLFNDGWEFAKQVLTETKNEEVPSVFIPVEIPHDWLIYDSYNLLCMRKNQVNNIFSGLTVSIWIARFT